MEPFVRQVQEFFQSKCVVLATASMSRQQILQRAGCLVGAVVAADIDEKAIRDPDPNMLTVRLASAKADACHANISRPGALNREADYILACDSVVIYDGQVREKPADLAEARTFLEQYSTGDMPIIALNGTCLLDLKTNKKAAINSKATFRMRPIPADSVERALRSGSVMHCAGGIDIDDAVLSPYVADLDGHPDVVRGLYLRDVWTLINQLA